MRNILHVIDTTGPGGAETVFIELIDRLNPELFSSVVVIRGPGWVNDELTHRGIKPYIVDAKGSFNFKYLLKLIRIIHDENIDLVQAHLLGSSVYCSIAGLLTGRPVVVTLHGVVDYDGEKYLPAKFLIINKLAARIILVSNDLSGRLQKKVKLNMKKISIVYNGIDIKSYSQCKNDEIRNQLGFGRDDPIVGSVGNVRVAKAYDILLNAAALLVKDVPHIKFVIVGDINNAIFGSLRELRTQLGLDNVVHFIGFRRNIARFLNSIDIFMLSSTTEGCPISVIEAMACGVPMVVTNCGGLSEMVKPNTSAVMCEINSALALKDGVIHILNDSELRKRLTANSIKIAESRFSIEAMIDVYSSIYIDII